MVSRWDHLRRKCAQGPRQGYLFSKERPWTILRPIQRPSRRNQAIDLYEDDHLDESAFKELVRAAVALQVATRAGKR
jgi:hypothetical protein